MSNKRCRSCCRPSCCNTCCTNRYSNCCTPQCQQPCNYTQCQGYCNQGCGGFGGGLLGGNGLGLIVLLLLASRN